MKHFLTALLVTFANAATATTIDAARDLLPDSAGILLGSHHFGATVQLEEFNPGVLAGWDCKFINTNAAIYRNSLGHRSVAVTWQSDFVSLSAGGFTAAPFVGVAHYPETGRIALASIRGTDWIVIGGIEFTHNAMPVFVNLMPGDQEREGYSFLVAVGMRWEF